MSDPTRRNRLADAPSPYLRQHADNPVHWQPWDETALAAARDRDVPVFLSVGYAACHWCHVMAEESFADPDVAAVLNDGFVPVKVDREERPDVDEVYMRVHQIVRGGGGWPLSVFLTPDLKPFYVTTYVPPEPRSGRPGFEQLCRDIATSWADPEERTEIEERARRWTAAVRDDLESVPEDPADPAEGELLAEAAAALVRQADRDHGGFGTDQKFPQPARLEVLFRADRRHDDHEARAVATETLTAMAKGGLRDHVGGGFHRYCTDRSWTVPHFEKMLYDNVTLARTFLTGHRVTGRERYATVVEETFDFLDRELRAPDGCFYASLDARSGDEEGRYYVWTPAEVRAAMDRTAHEDPAALAELARKRWGITADGAVEGRSVPTAARAVEDLAATRDRPVEQVARDLETAREALRAARADRERPPRDEKVIAGWNGLAVSALAEAGLTLDPAYATEAARTLDAVRERLWDGTRLARRAADGDVGVEGYLADHAFLARAGLETYGATGEPRHLRFALALARRLVARFHDADRETLFVAAEDGGAPLARPQALRDRSTPSATGVACAVLLALEHVAPEEGFGDVAAGVLARHGETVRREPTSHASMVAATDRLDRGVVEVTLAGEPDRATLTTIAGVPEPDRVLYPRPATEAALTDLLEDLDLDTDPEPDQRQDQDGDHVPPVWADRGVREGDWAAYVCRRSCSPPLESAAAVVEWLDRFGRD